MALSVVYFRIMHRLGRPHCIWDKYLYNVLEKVEVRVTVCVTVLCSVIVLCGMMMMMKGRQKVKPVCWLIACSSRKAPRGPPRLTSSSDGRIAINSTICLLNICTVEGFGI